MPDKQIKDFTAQTTINDTDQFILQQVASDTTKKTLWSTIKSNLLTYLNLGTTTGLTTGWVPISGTFSYSSADSPIYEMTVVSDITDTISVGQRIKLEQYQPLSAYWSFDTNSTEEISGLTMTNIGTPTYTAGKFSNALTLNGTDQALKVADNSFKPSGAFSIFGWVKGTDATAAMNIFQSWSITSSKDAGFLIGTIITTGTLNILTGKKTGTTINVDYSQIIGTINVCDGNYHYIMITYKDNWLQVYVDGYLDCSGYVFAPVFDTTSYARIGVYTPDGSTNTLWFKGQIDDLCYVENIIDEKTYRDKYYASTAQGTGDIILIKNFIVSLSPVYAGGSTTITLDGGTDFALINDTISNVYYSGKKIPYGFNSNENKWSVQFWDSVQQNQTNGSGVNYYNLGSFSLISPKGKRKIKATGTAYFILTTTRINMMLAISTSSTSFDNSEHTININSYDSGGQGFYLERLSNIQVKKTYYFMVRGDVTNTAMYLQNSFSKFIFKSTNSFL